MAEPEFKPGHLVSESLLSIHVLSSQKQPWDLGIIHKLKKATGPWVVKLFAQHYKTGKQLI